MPEQAEPLVSTIIPTFRRPQLLRRAILSVLSQQGPPLQVCVYDNASDDETEQVVQAIAARDARVRYFRHQRNIGGLANFQYGLSQVTTPFFTFLSDDDVQLPGFFEAAMQGFATFPEAMFWAGITVRMNDEGTVFDARMEGWPGEGLFTPPSGLFQMLGGGSPAWTGVVFRREVVRDVGLLDMDVGGPADLDYFLRVSARFPFIVAKRPVALFLLNDDSFSEQAPLSAFWPGWIKMIENLAGIEQLDAGTRAQGMQRLNNDARRMLFRRAANALARGRYDFSRQAAEVLRLHYHRKLRSALLRGLTALCANSTAAQAAYSMAYRAAERRLLARRKIQQERYGHLSRHLLPPAAGAAGEIIRT